MIVSRQKKLKISNPVLLVLQTQYKNTLLMQKPENLKMSKKSKTISLIAQSEFEIVFNKPKKEKKVSKLFDLTSLQISCNNRFNLSAEETLK